MAHQYFFGLLVLLFCLFLEASSRPSNNELPATFNIELPEEEIETKQQEKEEKSVQYEQMEYKEEQDNTKEILDKIKAINDGLTHSIGKKKPMRQQINFNTAQHHTGGGYIIDKETLEKIKQIIASGKLHAFSDTQKQQESNSLNNDDNYRRYENAKALRFLQPTLTSNGLTGSQAAMALMPVPYVTNIPVIVMPSVGNLYSGSDNDLNSIQTNAAYQTRQRPPSLPFQIQWPLAQYFPILIKDPLLGFLHGGGWENFVEYGQNADVCNRKQKSSQENDEQVILDKHDENILNSVSLNPIHVSKSRQGRAIKKRTISKSTTLQDVDNIKKVKKFFSTKPVVTKTSTKKPYIQEPVQDTKSTDEGDLRFPFGDFTWFGNRKPVAPSPGFFINRLKVRRGGVAIAGPGGVATAGRGGAAIVGPGGLAYTQPGGLAVAGPAARVVALSSDADLNSIVSRLQQQSATDGSVPRLLQAIPEGKVVATGPVIYYHPY